MIELRNITKIYHSKKGTSTKALYNIDLNIGNTGMVFIVGKSGSGKSTLLNLLGGLDNPTNGDIVINGKKISTFTEKEYDSYRNSHVGFIFQEFNVLEEYNVYQNIELALKLQNEKTSKENIQKLLEILGIEELKFRRINELSGGQKGRVAIARALVKNPELILADEPTGNLDQKTGKQIFEILKNISKDRLVIIISHNMEAAREYADRIIELKDGNIVSDTGKSINIENSTLELKKSKLPFPYAFKMAFTRFKMKPFRLFMTVILTAMSLIFMGITVNCALFQTERFVTNVMKDNKDYVYDIHYSSFGRFGLEEDFELTDKNIQELKQITNSNLNVGYILYDNGAILNFKFGKNDNSSAYYIEPSELHFIEIEDDRILENIIGTVPQNSNEIVIHKYLADYIIKYGIVLADISLYIPKNYNEIVTSKKEIKLGENSVIITGIIDEDDRLYLKAKETEKFSSEKLENYFHSNYQSKGNITYVKGFTDNAILRGDKTSILSKIELKSDRGTSATNEIKVIEEDTRIITKEEETNVFSLDKNEVILSLNSLKELEGNFDTKFNTYLKEHGNGIYSELLEEFTSIYIKENIDNVSVYLNSLSEDDLDGKRIPLQLIGVSLNENNYISNEYEPIIKKVTYVKVYDNNIEHLMNTFKQLVLRTHLGDKEYGNYYNYSVNNLEYMTTVIGLYDTLLLYILIVSMIFILFTFLLFSNFITLSISYSKKEIGILRSLGARNVDIIKIFVYESLFIGLISWIISMVGFFIICHFLNQSLFGNSYFIMRGIIMHPLIPIITLALTIFIALFVTTAPITRITKIKPIDIILNR